MYSVKTTRCIVLINTPAYKPQCAWDHEHHRYCGGIHAVSTVNPRKDLKQSSNQRFQQEVGTFDIYYSHLLYVSKFTWYPIVMISDCSLSLKKLQHVKTIRVMYEWSRTCCTIVVIVINFILELRLLSILES